MTTLTERLNLLINSIGSDIKSLFANKLDKTAIVPLTNGGTGATNASQARSNLGFLGKVDGGFHGISIDNTGVGKGTSAYIDFNLHKTMKGGIRIIELDNGMANIDITCTPAGDTNTRRDVLGLVISSTGIFTYSYGILHEYFARLDNINQTIKSGAILAGSASYKKGWRKLTATLPSQAGEISIAHGVTTIETIQAKVTSSDGLIIFNNDIDPANQFYVRVDGANIVLGVTANSNKVFDKPVTIYVGEEL